MSVFLCPSASLSEAEYEEKTCFLGLCADGSICRSPCVCGCVPTSSSQANVQGWLETGARAAC